MTLAELQHIQSEQEKSIVVRFEPWNFTDTNQLLNQFFVRLANELQSKGDKCLTKIGEAVEHYSEAIGEAVERYSAAWNFLKLIPNVGPIISEVGKLSAQEVGRKMQKTLDDRDVLKQKKQVIELLEKQSKHIIIVIDDIDRLSNEQIRYIFQLITSVAKFPNITYLLAFDKDIVVEALKGVQSGDGLNYLEKIIQVPITVPDIRRSALHNILIQQLKEINNDFTDLGYDLEYWDRILASYVDPFIKHIRDINRLCNMLRFKLTSIATEIDFADMIAISILEIHHPLVFEWIKNHKSVLTGENDFTRFGTNKSVKDWRTHYTDVLEKMLEEEGSETNAERLIDFLSKLFPRFGMIIGVSCEENIMEQMNRNNRIGSSSKFERYFVLDIDQLPYRTEDVHNILAYFDAETIKTVLLMHEKRGTSYELLQDIQSHIVIVSEERAKVLILALSGALFDLNQDVQMNIFSVNTRFYVEHSMLLQLMERISYKNRKDFITGLIQDANTRTLYTSAYIVHMVELGYGRMSANSEEDSTKQIITLNELISVEDVFVRTTKKLLANNSLFDFFGWERIHLLLDRFDPKDTKDYLHKEFTCDGKILRFLSRFVTIWKGKENNYQVKEDYTAYFSKTQGLNAIQNCRQDGTLFDLPEKLQCQCAAFFLADSMDSNSDVMIDQSRVEEVLTNWRADFKQK